VGAIGVAAQLARHPHAEVRLAVAANAATPPAVLAALLTGDGLPPGAACDGSDESTVFAIQQNALGNPSTPAGAVIGFVDHPSMLLRRELAARPDLPARVYAQLAEDAIPWGALNVGGERRDRRGPDPCPGR
jgi:hypothetical protein